MSAVPAPPSRWPRPAHRAAPRRVGDYARRWWTGVRAGELGLAADRRRPDHHRDRLPDPERPLPHRGQLRQPDRPAGAPRDHRHGHRLRAAARRDRPVGRLRHRRRRRARPRCCSLPDGNEFAAGPAIVIALRRRGLGDRHAPRPDHHQDRRPVVRRHARRPARLERRRAAADRQPRHRDPPERLRHRLANDFLARRPPGSLAVACVALYAGVQLAAPRVARKAGLRDRPDR